MTASKKIVTFRMPRAYDTTPAYQGKDLECLKIREPEPHFILNIPAQSPRGRREAIPHVLMSK